MQFNLLSGLLSLGTISSLLAIGAFVQKQRDLGEAVIKLEDRIDKLEEQKIEGAKLEVKVDGLSREIKELKDNLKEEFKLLRMTLKAGV